MPATAERTPTAPKWLGEGAKRQWRRIAPGLHAVGLLTEVDVTALGLMCEALAQYFEARALVDMEGMMAMSDKGNRYQHPALAVMKSTRQEVLKWAAQFGMTPSARSRITLDTDAAEPSLADMLFEMVGQ
jgi:P27 family predicted phage terminase small subunit